MISPMDQINIRLARQGQINVSKMLRDLISHDEQSREKGEMRTGVRYYEGKHDILDHDFQKSYVYDTDEQGNELPPQLIENKNKSNQRVVHNFHRHHVDQKVSYILGKPMSVTVEGAGKNSDLKAYEDEITKWTSDEQFADKMISYVTGASNRGVDWLHFYYDKAGELRYTIVPAGEIIVGMDEENQEVIADIIHYWTVDRINGSETVKRHRVAWWTASDVTYYEEVSEGEYVLRTDLPVNPSPHWYQIRNLNGKPVKSTAMSWGRVPFIPLYNNDLHESDLYLYKGLQDAYNYLSSTAVNDQIDLVGLYWVISGYGGETSKAIAKRLQINGFVNIEGGDGNIRAEQVTLNISERLAFLKSLRNDIYHIGRAFDEAPETVQNATNVALEIQYTNLDLKANPLIAKLKLALKDFMWFVTQHINRKMNKQWDPSLVRVDVKKTVIINETEKIDGVMASRGLVPDKLLLAAHPYVDDVNEAIKELEAQKKAESAAYSNNDEPYPEDGDA